MADENQDEFDVDLTLPKEVAERLHAFGDSDTLFSDVEDAFLQSCDREAFSSWERSWYDPETKKVYRTYLKLCVEQSRPDEVPEDECPECGEPTADATDIPDDSICDACGWSKSGVRRCIRCGTKDPERLVEGDAVCSKCRA